MAWMAEPLFRHPNAGVAQLVERQLPKLNVAGSSPVARSRTNNGRRIHAAAVGVSTFRS